MTEKPSPWAGMSKEEILAAMPPFKKRPKKAEPAPKVTEPKVIVELASCNPNVPIERQRERISEAQKRLVEDQNRRLKEWKDKKKHEKWLADNQANIDWHMEQKLINEEWQRHYRDNPDGHIEIFNQVWGPELRDEREAHRRQRQNALGFSENSQAVQEREQKAAELDAKREEERYRRFVIEGIKDD
jgi:hypothetical protein